MDLKDWLTDEQIKKINGHLETMAREKIAQSLRNILPPIGRTRREFMYQVDIGLFRQHMIQYFTVTFRDIILPDVFPNGIPESFEPTSKIRERIFYAGVVTTVRQMFLRKVLFELYDNMDRRWQLSNPSIHTMPPTRMGGYKQYIEK